MLETEKTLVTFRDTSFAISARPSGKTHLLEIQSVRANEQSSKVLSYPRTKQS